MQAKLDGTAFLMDKNKKNIKEVSFQFKGKGCLIKFKTDTRIVALQFGNGYWQEGLTIVPEPSLVSGAKTNVNTLAPFKVACSYYWENEYTLRLLAQYLEGVQAQAIICRFCQQHIKIFMVDPISQMETILEGNMLTK